MVSDFSVLNVWENSHSKMPDLYKFTGVWGNHEGSMLLWLLILTFFSALVAAFGNNLPASLKANVLAVQGWIAVAFLLAWLVPSTGLLVAERVGRGHEQLVRLDPGQDVRHFHHVDLAHQPIQAGLASHHPRPDKRRELEGCA